MATLSWTTGTSGLWTTASNWSPAQVPASGDSVLVTQPGAYLVTMPAAVSVELAGLTMSDALGSIKLGGSVQVDSNLTISSGTLQVTGSLNVVSGFSNAGTLLDGGSVTLNGTVTAAALKNIQGGTGGTLTVTGAVINTGGTFDGNLLGNQINNLGTILGGTMVNWGNPPNAVLDGVTWRGPLSLFGTLAIADGLTVTGVNGIGPGTLTTGSVLPGQQGNALDFINSQTFDNAAFTGVGNIIAGTTLTIGSSVTFTENPTATQTPASIGFSGGTIFNRGTILGHSTSTNTANLSNSGAISLAANDFENFGVISGIDMSTPGTIGPFMGLDVFTGQMLLSIGGSAFVNHVSAIIEIGQSAGVSSLTVGATAFTNDGTILTRAPSATAGGTVDIAAFLAGSGTIDLTGNGTVTLESGAASTQSLDFTGQGTLVLDQPASVPATINGFSIGDDIHLAGVGATGVSYTNGDLRLLVIGSASTIDLAITGAHSLADFVINTQGVTTDIQLACFAAGTRLATTRGLVTVETLREGDAMLLADREGSLPVVWIGHREVDCRRHLAPHKVWPVRIAAGAFARGVPRRDLYLSPDHAVFVRSVLIPVKYLVNETTIAQVAVDGVSYWHVELQHHAALLAEGLSVESLLPGGDRSGFINGGGMVALHPTWAWEGEGCAPLVVTGPDVAAVRATLAQRSKSNQRSKLARMHSSTATA